MVNQTFTPARRSFLPAGFPPAKPGRKNGNEADALQWAFVHSYIPTTNKPGSDISRNRGAGRKPQTCSSRHITAFLHRHGCIVNHKRVERIWRQEGLKVPMKQPKRGRLWLTDGSCVSLRPGWTGHVWSYDFVMARTRWQGFPYIHHH
jgi:hypothetical protein